MPLRLTFALILLALQPAAASDGDGAPPLAVISNLPGEPLSALHRVAAGARSLPPPLVTFEHLPGAVVRAAALPDGSVVAVADRLPLRELSWAAALYRLAPGRAVVIADRVYHASRPLVTRRGRLFVERGHAGVEPGADEARAGRLRVDDLTIDEIDPASGRARTVYAWRGYTTHLAAEAGGEILVYRVGPDGADLIALDPDRGRSRAIARLPPFARDFSVDDRGRLVFASRQGDAWTVEQLDPRSGARALLASGQSGHAAPHAWPGAGVVCNPDGDGGLAFVLPPQRGGRKFAAPAGPGVDVVRATSADGAWAAALHYAAPDEIPDLIVIHTGSGQALRLPRPAGVRLEIAGFAGGTR